MHFYAPYLWGVCTCMTDPVPMHELLANDIFTNAGGGSQIVKLVKELHTALVVLGGILSQLIP